MPLSLFRQICYKNFIIINIINYYGSTNDWMPRVKNKSFGRAANRNQKKKLGKNDLIKVS